MRINHKIDIPEHELQEEFMLASGPGGQNINKVSTAVRLSWNIAESTVIDEWTRERLLERLAGKLTTGGVLIMTSQNHRTQPLNRKEAHQRMAALIRGALITPKVRRPTKPTRASVERRLASKRKHAEQKSLRRNLHD